jgi:hypothetical protein
VAVAGGFGTSVGSGSPGWFGLSVAVTSGTVVDWTAVGRGGVAVGTRTVARMVGVAVGVSVAVAVAVAVGRGTRSGASAA